MFSWFLGFVIALVLAMKVVAVGALILACIVIWAIFRFLYRAAGTVSPHRSKPNGRVFDQSPASGQRPVCRYDEARPIPEVVVSSHAESAKHSSRRRGSSWWAFWCVFGLVAVVAIFGVRSRRDRHSVEYRFAAPAQEVRTVPTARKADRRVDKRNTAPAPTRTVAVVEKPAVPPNPSWSVTGTGETLEHAKEDACMKAWERLVEFLRENDPSLEWSPSPGFVRKHFATHWGAEENANLEGVGPVIQIPLYLELTPAKSELIAQQDKHFRVENRMSWLLKIFGGLVVLLAAVAAYLRLDEWSKGYYTGVLRVAAAVFVAASAAGMWFVVQR